MAEVEVESEAVPEAGRLEAMNKNELEAAHLADLAVLQNQDRRNLRQKAVDWQNGRWAAAGSQMRVVQSAVVVEGS